MAIPFCDHHVAAFFSIYESAGKASSAPLDLALGGYFKAHKSLGAQDRRTIGDAVFGMVRWKTLLGHLCPSADALQRLRHYKNIDFGKAAGDPSIPEPIRLGVPDLLFDRLKMDFGLDAARNICKILNTPAPMTIRANLLKTTREHLLDLWKEYPISPCLNSRAGIHFKKRFPLFSLPEFKEGLFEVQDEGSQVVASLVAAQPGESVLDFCSGSGGKTLAFAPAMQGRGQIYLHDIRPSVLLEAKKRLKRAGIQNAQCLPPGHSQLARLKEKCDWVLIDVPCSGTGTLRRNPDQKWRIDAPMIKRLVEEQRKIASEALMYLRPGGRLVYATCSLLTEENQAQADALLADYPLVLENAPVNLLPQEGGMDGFFSATFRKIRSML